MKEKKCNCKIAGTAIGVGLVIGVVMVLGIKHLVNTMAVELEFPDEEWMEEEC